jgi:hypothetical protein
MQAMRDSGRAGMHIAVDLLAYEELGTGDCSRADDSLKKIVAGHDVRGSGDLGKGQQQ